MEDEFTKKFAGFYIWEDAPCRVLPDDNNNLCAEIYVKGKGFCPMSLNELIWEGRSVSEKTFKAAITYIAVTP